MTDLRLAIRTFARVPIFAAAVVLTIALGVGATTAVFSVVYGVLYRPLPYPDADRLVAVWKTIPPRPDREPDLAAFLATRAFIADSLLRTWQREARCFDAIGGYAPQAFAITAGGEAQRVEGAIVTSGFLTALGARPVLGRLFHPEDDPPAQPKIVVLGHGFWKQRFAGDRDIVGKTIRIDGVPHVVIGVLPADFHVIVQYGTRDPALYAPMGYQYKPYQPFAIMPGTVARLKPGITVAAAQAQMTAVMRHLAETDRYARRNGAFVTPLAGEAVETARGTRAGLLILLAATGCVLLIACVNVANLLLVRASTRHRELGVRTALGASRWRIVRQMVVESLVLSIAGGLLGLLLAAWGTDLLVALMPPNLFPRMEDVRVDAHVLVFGLIASGLAGMLAGLAPAWYSLGRDRRGSLGDTLKDGHRSGTGGRGARYVRRGLVTAEVVLAMVLCVGAGLLARTYVGLLRVDLGIRPEGLLGFHLSFVSPRYASGENRAALVAAMLERLRATSGVETAGATSSMPLQRLYSFDVSVAGDGQPMGEMSPSLSGSSVTDGFFEAAGIGLASGRFFLPADARAEVAIVNRALVKRIWPSFGADTSRALGRILTVEMPALIRLSSSDVQTRPRGPAIGTYRIVGVVGDVKSQAKAASTEEMVYLPYSSHPTPYVSVVVRTAGEPASLAPAARNIARSLDQDLAIEDVEPLANVLAATIAAPRFQFAVIGAFAFLALVLAIIGLYGVVAQSVAQRTQEIGIRLVLGASRRRIAGMVLVEAVALALAGVAGGIATSLAASRVLSRFLFGVKPTDATTYAVVGVVLIAVAVVACLMPARRAAAIEPVVALRNE